MDYSPAKQYRLYDKSRGLYYAGSRNGHPHWSGKPKMFTSLNTLRQSMRQSHRHINTGMVIQTCEFKVVDVRNVTEDDLS